MTDLILASPLLSTVTFFAGCFVLLWATVAWHEVRLRKLDDVPSASTLMEVPADETVWLRCSPLEWIPICAGDLQPGDRFMFPDAYQRMKNSEAARDYQAFWAATNEDSDTAEIETEPGDNWPTDGGDIGNGDA